MTPYICMYKYLFNSYLFEMLNCQCHDTAKIIVIRKPVVIVVILICNSIHLTRLYWAAAINKMNITILCFLIPPIVCVKSIKTFNCIFRVHNNFKFVHTYRCSYHLEAADQRHGRLNNRSEIVATTPWRQC